MIVLGSLLASAAILPAMVQQAPMTPYEKAHLQVGMRVPDLTGKDENGKSFQLSSYRGKVVVLDFFGFW